MVTIFAFIHINEISANFERKEYKNIRIYFSMFANSDAVAFVTLLRDYREFA